MYSFTTVIQRDNDKLYWAHPLLLVREITALHVAPPGFKTALGILKPLHSLLILIEFLLLAEVVNIGLGNNYGGYKQGIQINWSLNTM